MTINIMITAKKMNGYDVIRYGMARTQVATLHRRERKAFHYLLSLLVLKAYEDADTTAHH